MPHQSTETMPPASQHTIVALLRDKPGTLHRAVTLFRRRAFNVSSLHVERTEQDGFSRMTVSIEAHNPTALMQELDRLVDVLSVRDVTPRRCTTGEAANASCHWQADGIPDGGEVS